MYPKFSETPIYSPLTEPPERALNPRIPKHHRSPLRYELDKAEAPEAAGGALFMACMQLGGVL